MEPFISTFDIKWKTIELAGSKDNCCFHFIFQLNLPALVHSLVDLVTQAVSGSEGNMMLVTTAKAHASLYSPMLNLIVSNCRLFPWLSSDPYRSDLLVTTSVPLKNTSISINWSLVLWNTFQINYHFLLSKQHSNKGDSSNASLFWCKAKINGLNLDILCSKHDLGKSLPTQTIPVASTLKTRPATLSTKPSAPPRTGMQDCSLFHTAHPLDQTRLS